MEVVQNAVNTAADIAFDVEDAARRFDLEKENIGGFFTNLTLLSMALLSVARDRKPFPKKGFKEEYDYVVVGGGSAGAVMASRLSENRCVNVLLLEAGGVAPLLTEVPSLARFFFGSNIDWLYRTVPQEYAAFGHKNRQVLWNNGKALGGSSVLNAMLYVRGNRRNFDQWEADGATGWGWDDVFPFYLKLEDNRDVEELEPGYHRRGGPQTAEGTNYIPEIKEPILEAGKAMGYEIRDINGRRQTGMYKVQATVRNQQRCSTAKSYLEPARHRDNLDILTYAYARKILIRKRHGVNEAYGVEFDHANQVHTVRARREVIISNGAVKTPQILILSGIGPREQLEKLNIPVVADLPVGKNLQDHISTNLIYSLKETIMPVIPKLLNPVNILDYIVNRREAMEVVQNAVNTAADIAFNVEDAARPFDLEKENIGGFFTNLTLLSMALLSVARDRKPFPKKGFKEEYDYVVVGGGSAGAVMASRLSENRCVNVLLLEAGGVAPLLTEVPSLARFFFGSNIDWLYRTVPQEHAAFGHKNRQVLWNNGKALGGSSVLNAMLYVRGNRRNFDQWEADGATGWGWDDVFPFYLKLEDNRDVEELEPGSHRRGGPQTAEGTNYIPEIKDPILEAGKAMGYEIRDINGRRQTGMYKVQATVRNQQRCSTAKSYLEPARHRDNLDILTYAYARKILIRKRHGVSEAYGVEFDHANQVHTVRARTEVIISNGAVKTPQILILSGIGPREQLEKLNIPVVADLPVGKNLQDHISTNLIYSLKETIMPVIPKLLNPVNILDYIVNRRGPLTAPTMVNVLAFLDGLNTSRYSRDFPRQEIYFGEYEVLDAKVNLNLRDEVYDRVYAPYELKPIYICYSSLLQPYSRGEITLNSTDPYAMPVIDPRYYEDERDLKDVVEGMKICEAIVRQPAMRQVEARLIETQRTGFPNCEKLEGNQDRYFACIARNIINTFWHFSGTARMGHPDDPRSVVDPELRVIGVDNLRVVSAAIFPTLPSANTNVPTIMVAEKAYHMMKRDIRCENNHQQRRKGRRRFRTRNRRQ